MKKYFLAVILVLCALTLFGCGETTFDDLTIIASDASDVPEGEYTLRYAVAHYESFLSAHPGLELFVTVVDEQNKQVSVRNNRVIDVEKGKTYTVNVALSYADGERIRTKNKQFVIVAEKIPPVVTLHVGQKAVKIYRLEYGESVDYEEVKAFLTEVRFEDLALYPEPGLSDGYKWELVSKKIVFGSLNSDKELTPADLTGIEVDRDVYLKRVYRSTGLKTYSITFHNEGGTETEPIVGTYASTVLPPAVYPQKPGCVFGGWYDALFTERFDWTLSSHKTLTADFDLYAKWYPASPTDVVDRYDYEYRQSDDEGYPYYLIKGKSDADYSGRLVLPVGKDNVIVKGFVDRAFAGEDIESVVIPETYVGNNYYAFFGCASLTEAVFADGSRLTFLNDSMFADCVRLTAVRLPMGVETFGTAVFSGCSSLASIVLPDALTVINEDCFAGCALTEVAVPDSVHTVAHRAFLNDKDLSSITFGQDSDLYVIYADSLEGTAVTEIVLPYYFYEAEKTPFADTDIVVRYHRQPTEEEEK
ncbi:MAG: leucine-rich repeat protein [Clostridia bacterium]|nr:leucine-rich repeat protein [Clostridia bacterium]